jgi:hypothetical protein
MQVVGVPVVTGPPVDVHVKDAEAAAESSRIGPATRSTAIAAPTIVRLVLFLVLDGDMRAIPPRCLNVRTNSTVIDRLSLGDRYRSSLRFGFGVLYHRSRGWQYEIFRSHASLQMRLREESCRKSVIRMTNKSTLTATLVPVLPPAHRLEQSSPQGGILTHPPAARPRVHVRATLGVL